ncbi:MAG: hypothetical protein NTU44_01095 [Bacteroidetes bacterium]|nr:hypothetical protein [Bacteroidota bacterium]
MRNIEIPHDLKAGFEAISQVDNQQLMIIIDVLNSFPLGFNVQRLVKQLSEHGIDISNIDLLSQSIFYIGNVILQHPDAPKEDILGGLIDSYSKKNHSVAGDILEQLKNNLQRIIGSIHNIVLTIKAIRLFVDNERNFQEVKIITDIRTVFDEPISRSPKNALIIHQLRITYLCDYGEIKDIHFSLSNEDLQKFRDHITRAIEKESEIVNTLSNNQDINVIQLL